MTNDQPAAIWAIAGPNGGGKSSLLGQLIRQRGADYFNPDDLTQALLDQNPELPRERANSLAWKQGVNRLREAIAQNLSFAFETTLGGRTISRLLHRAADRGMVLKIWYVALGSADLHVARVRERVARGGHDIPETRIRARYDASRANLAGLLPRAALVRVYDNSYQADVERGERPRPKLLLDFVDGQIRNRRALADTPEWAKPIVAAAIRSERRT